MRREFELGEVIAERRLVFEATPGWTRDVRIKIGRPVLDASAPRVAWVCPFQIEGLGSDHVMGIFASTQCKRCCLLFTQSQQSWRATSVILEADFYSRATRIQVLFPRVERFSNTLATRFRQNPSDSRRTGRAAVLPPRRRKALEGATPRLSGRRSDRQVEARGDVVGPFGRSGLRAICGVNSQGDRCPDRVKLPDDRRRIDRDSVIRVIEASSRLVATYRAVSVNRSALLRTNVLDQEQRQVGIESPDG